MSEPQAPQVRMTVLSTDDLKEVIRFCAEVLGFPLKFRGSAHFAALDGGSVTLRPGHRDRPPRPGRVAGFRTDDVDGAARAIDAAGPK